MIFGFKQKDVFLSWLEPPMPAAWTCTEDIDRVLCILKVKSGTFITTATIIHFTRHV
eukprot:m.359599 g.359599  ORF g.359599 m.359599 type:complete len:57 (-) comp20761_c0_seq2:102-272(-)